MALTRKNPRPGRRPLDRAALDSLAGHGCQAEDCRNAERHAHVLWMNQRCHVGAPLFMDNLTPDAITFRCVVPPFDLVTEVAGQDVSPKEGGDFNAHGTFEQRCHDTSAVRASYQHDSAVVRVECYHCEKLVAEVAVK